MTYVDGCQFAVANANKATREAAWENLAEIEPGPMPFDVKCMVVDGYRSLYVMKLRKDSIC